MKSFFIALGVASALAPLQGSGPVFLQDAQTDWAERIRDLKESLPQFFGPNMTLSKPAPVQRAIAEWEPSRALVVGVPLGAAMKDSAIFAYYGSLISVATQYVDVAILHNIRDERHIDLFLTKLKEGGVGEESRKRIRFVRASSGTHWVRDSAPLFALDPQGGLLALDNIYRPLVPEIEAWNLAPSDIDTPSLMDDPEGFSAFVEKNRGMETVPIYVAKFMRQMYQYPCDVVRPPLHLQGGDYMTDGKGRICISEDTLIENGGSLQDVESVFRDYYGAREVLVLNALPGVAAKHLDLLAKLVDENTLLLSEAPTVSDVAGSHHRRLVADIAEIRKANQAYLKRKAPDLKVIGMPMLPVVEEDAAYVRARLQGQVFATVCEELGVHYLKYFRLPKGDPQRVVVQKKVVDHLSKQFNLAFQFAIDAHLDQAVQVYMGADLQTLLGTHVDTQTVYRSYLNSLQIVTESGQSAWLVPRYKPRGKETPESIAAIEKEVERIYREVSPSSNIHWLDSDVMTEMLGAIHCTTFTIPAIAVEES